MELRPQRVHGHGVGPRHGGPHSGGIDEQAGTRHRLEVRGRITARRTRFEKPAFGLPFVEAAVEHGRVVKAQRAQHPPEARRPHHCADAVEHHARTGPDAVPAESRLQPGSRRHHEMQVRGRIGKFALQIEEAGTGDVTFLERLTAGYGVVGFGRAGRCWLQVGRAVEHAQRRIAQRSGQGGGIDQGTWIAHRGVLRVQHQTHIDADLAASRLIFLASDHL